MTDYPKSGNTVKKNDIQELQRSVTGIGRSLFPENTSRGCMGPDVLNDSVIYCARNWGVNERIDFNQNCNIKHHSAYPESIRGPYWGVEVPTSDSVTRYPHSSIYHREERRRWTEIPTHSSRRVLAGEDLNIVKHVTTDDWLGENDYDVSSHKPFREDFGSNLMKIPNNGNSYSLFYHSDLNLAQSLDNDLSLNPKEYKRWLGGHRVWTAVIYCLLPNENSERVICWSPGHMLGASASEVQNGQQAKAGQLHCAHLAITHSYTDIIRINNSFITRLCEAQGIDHVARKMYLDGTSYFGWKVVGALDRWDRVPPSKGGGLTALVDDISQGTTPNQGELSYRDGQMIVVNGGSTSIMAFKDPDAQGLLDRKSSLLNYRTSSS